jgi:UDP-galactopyranose mutase
VGGYNKLIEGLFKKTKIKLGVDFFANRKFYESLAKKIIFTGKIDEYYDYRFGKLEYRSLRFEEKVFDIENYQGNAGVNFTDFETPYTRIIEHKHFEFGQQAKTVITKEYPLEGTIDNDPYYPINDLKNEEMYQKYKKLSVNDKKVIFSGRLAEYKYYDMDDIIGNIFSKKIL